MKSTPENESTKLIKAAQGIAKTLWKYYDVLSNSAQHTLEKATSPPLKGLWNEKTVEYHFARFILPSYGPSISLAAPLVGDEEEMFGDLIAGPAFDNAERFCLIEFKATANKFHTEYEKYLRTASSYRTGALPARVNGETVPFRAWFSEENKDLLNLIASKNHYFIYGAIDGNNFVLRFEPYTTECIDPKLLKTFDTLDFCDDIDFGRYLLALAAARSKLPSGGGRGKAFYSEAQATIIEKLSATLVISNSGRVMSAADKVTELSLIFKDWNDVKESDRALAMGRKIWAYIRAKRINKLTQTQNDKIEENIRKACAITKILAEMHMKEHSAEKAIGAS